MIMVHANTCQLRPKQRLHSGLKDVKHLIWETKHIVDTLKALIKFCDWQLWQR